MIPAGSASMPVCFFYDRIGCVVSALKQLSNSQNKNKKEVAEARGLLTQVVSYDVIFPLIVLHDLLSVTQSLSLQLQSSSLDFGNCRRLIDATIKTLTDKRTDDYFDAIWRETRDKAAEVGAELPTERSERVIRPSLTIADENTVAYGPIGQRQSETDSTDVSARFRRIFFEIGELDRRFTTNDVLMHAVALWQPVIHRVVHSFQQKV